MTTEPYKPRDITSDFAIKASAQAKATTDRVLSGSAMMQGREAAERMEAVAGNVRSAVDKSLKEQPMATLAIAAAFAFVLGAIWKS